MARIARIVVANLPHHITQRGNRRQKTFFQDEDYRLYRRLMADWCNKHTVEVWAYCLMPNHVHLVAVPGSEDSLRRAIGEAHRRYTRHVNFREGWLDIYGRGDFTRFRWMKVIISLLHDMWNSIL
jgi:putative transposase